MSQFIYLSFRWITDLSIYSHSPTASLHRRFAPPRTLPRYRITNPTPQHSNRTPSSQSQHEVVPGFLVPPGVLAETGSAWDPGSGRRLSRRVSSGIPLSYNLKASPRIITLPRITTPHRIIANETESPRETRSGQRPPPNHVSMDTVSTPAPPIPSPVSSDRYFVTEVEIRAPADTPVAKETPIRKTPKNSLGTTNVVEQETQKAPDSNTPIATPFPRRSTRKLQAPDSDAQIPTPNIKPEKQHPKSPHNELQVPTNTHTTPSMSRRPRRSTRTTPATKKTPLSKSHLQDTHTAVKSPIPPPTPPPLPRKKTRRSLRGSQDLLSAFPADVSEVNKTPPPTLRTPTPPPPRPKSNVEVVIKTPQPKVRVRATRSSTRRKVNLEFEFSDGELD